MKITNSLIILLILFSFTCYGQGDSEDLAIKNYNYRLEISEYLLAQNDAIICKYLVNKNWGEIKLDSIQMLDSEKIYYVQYNPDSTIKDYTTVNITNVMSDSIFRLVRDLFHLEKNVGTKTMFPEFGEGRYAKINLNLDNYDSRFTVSIGLENETIIRDKYYRLKKYLNETK